MVIAAGMAGFVSLLAARLVKNTLQQSQRSSLYSAMGDFQNDVLMITKNKERWIVNVQSSSPAAPMGAVARCLSSTSTPNCSALPDEKGLVDDIVQRKAAGFIVSSVNLINLVPSSGQPGTQISGKLNTPMCYDVNGHSLGTSASDDPRCRFLSRAYLLRQPGADPGAVSFLVSIEQNPLSLTQDKDQTMVAPMYLTIPIGTIWKNAVATPKVLLKSECATDELSQGWNSAGIETCLARTCPAGQILGGLNADGSITCVNPPPPPVSTMVKWDCVLRWSPPFNGSLPVNLNPANPAGYTLTLRPYNQHCTGVALTIGLRGSKGTYVNLPCRPLGGGANCFNHGGNSYINVNVRTVPSYDVQPADLKPLADAGETSFSIEYNWAYSSNGPGTTCPMPPSSKVAYGFSYYLKDNASPAPLPPPNCPGYSMSGVY